MGIGACLRKSGKEIGLVPGISEGSSLGRGEGISAIGIERVREREQNARNDALTAVARRVCMRRG